MKINWLQEKDVFSGCGADDGTNVTALAECKRTVNHEGENGMMKEGKMIPGSVIDF